MKHLTFFGLTLLLSGLWLSCTGKQESTFLSDPKACAETECTSPQSEIAGSLSIEADNGVYQKNVDQGDVVEIAGRCTDLGIRENRLEVQVIEGEDTSVAPYIDNASSSDCVNNLSTPGINGQKCFWVTQGKALVDAAAGVEYPRCFNGRFSFSVRLGKVLRTNPLGLVDEVGNPRLKYLVRFKLKTFQGSIKESQWNSAVVDRAVSKPQFTLASDFATQNCKLRLSAFKNLEDLSHVTYSAFWTRGFAVGTMITNPVQVYRFTATADTYYVGPYETRLAYAPPALNPRITEWNMAVDSELANHFLVIPGVKHFVRTVAYDKKYSYTYTPTTVPGVLSTSTEFSISEQSECPNIRSQTFATPSGSGATCTGGPAPIPQLSCTYSLNPDRAKDNVPGGFWEWRIIKGQSNWPENFEPTTPVGPTHFVYLPGTTQAGSISFSRSSLDATINAFWQAQCPASPSTALIGTWYAAARYVDPSGGKGGWSVPQSCTIN